MPKKFKLKSKHKPAGDQPKAISKLLKGLEKGEHDQLLLGVTGSGKTFTMANVIQKIQKPTLIMAHNKTLAAQLASEFRELFPDAAVNYFVSYYDYYQPEAYIAKSDTYIEKETQINEEIEKYRHKTTYDLLTRSDVIVVASVSAIYGLGSPSTYLEMAVKIHKGQKIQRNEFLRSLIAIQFRRDDFKFGRGTFRVRGDIVEVFPSMSDTAFRLEFWGEEIDNIHETDHLTGEVLSEMEKVIFFPAKHTVTNEDTISQIIPQIKSEMKLQVSKLKANGKEVEAQRLEQRTMYDLDMLAETGYVNGIENYTRYLSGAKPGQPPNTLLDFFPKKDWLLLIDESHMTVPQIGAMHQGNLSRKRMLIEHGFRLPSAFDNRPLTWQEFEKKIPQTIFVSATPGKYELAKTGVEGDLFTFLKNKKNPPKIAQQIIRPTGLLDPKIKVLPSEGQIDVLLEQIRIRLQKNERILITTITKKMAEELTDFLKENGLKVNYLHSEVDTLDRIKIIRDLRLGEIDIIVGINLLREGLDLPEVSLVAILDADKQGFLRSRDALLQTIGRTSRNQNGQVIMFGDVITPAMKAAIDETNRRRKIQAAFNKTHNITPQTIIKKVHDLEFEKADKAKQAKSQQQDYFKKLDKNQKTTLTKELESKMDISIQNMDFEKAAELRDEIAELIASK